MKITTTKLKELIKEELGRIHEIETIGASDARKQSRAQALDVGGSEVTSVERSAIVTLQKALLAAAKDKNIATGSVAALMQRLMKELEKLSPTQNQEEV